MTLGLLAIDLGKRSFHVYGIDTDGVILSQKVSRAKLAEVVGHPTPKVIVYCTTVMRQAAAAVMRPDPWAAAGRP